MKVVWSFMAISLTACLCHAEVDFTPVVSMIGATYDTPADIPPPNVPIVTPGCQYEDSLRFTIKLTQEASGQRQTYLSWLHPQTLAYFVVSGWKSNFATLSASEYPGINWPEASAALGQLETALDGSSLPFWRIFTLDTSVPQPVYQGLRRLATAGMQLPFLALTDQAKNDMLQLFLQSNFLSLFSQGGVGNLTMQEFYHTPADPETVSDDQVSQVISAINIGFFRTDFVVQCQSDVVAASYPGAAASEKSSIHLATANMCCSKTTRVCVSFAGLTCNMCGSFCCLGGANWCP